MEKIFLLYAIFKAIVCTLLIIIYLLNFC